MIYKKVNQIDVIEPNEDTNLLIENFGEINRLNIDSRDGVSGLQPTYSLDYGLDNNFEGFPTFEQLEYAISKSQLPIFYYQYYPLEWIYYYPDDYMEIHSSSPTIQVDSDGWHVTYADGDQ